jgi:ATP-dependent protease ClpP protease subunit
MKLIQIENRSGKLRLNDSVNPWSTDDLITEIEKLYGGRAVENRLQVGGFMASAEEALENVDIEIHSPGGSVLDGYRVYHALLGMRQRGVHVTATINTLAASMASVIAMGADKIRMVDGGMMMIHEASQTVSGNSADHARAAKILDDMSDEIAAIYAARTGGDHDEMRALMKAETWMGTKDAKVRNFIDEIVTGAPVDIRATQSTNPPMSLLSKLFPGNDQVPLVESQIAQIDNLAQEVEARAGEVTALKGEVSNLHQALAEKEAAIYRFATELATAKAEIATQAENLAEAATKLEAAEASAAQRAVALAAEAGIAAPLPIDAAESTAENSITREEFRKLSPTARAAFLRSGGQIS